MSEQNGSNPEKDLHASPDVQELEGILPDTPEETVDAVLRWAARQVILGRIDEIMKFAFADTAGYHFQTFQEVEHYFMGRVLVLETQYDELRDDQE